MGSSQIFYNRKRALRDWLTVPPDPIFSMTTMQFLEWLRSSVFALLSEPPGVQTVQGGSSGTKSPLTTKGDVWGFDTADNRIPVGVDGQILSADSTQPLGVKWASNSTCGLGVVAKIEVPATSGASAFQIAHGLGYEPSVGVIEPTSDGLIRFQTPTLKYDNANVYLSSSDIGLTASVKLLAPCNCTGGTPSITSFSPTDANEGDIAFTLTVNGVNFRADSVVYWNGSPRVTTYVNQLQVTVAITAADVAIAGTAEISVNNPNAGCGLSDTVAFDIYHYVSGIGAFEIVREGLVPDTFVGGYATPETISVGDGPTAIPEIRRIQDVKVTTDAVSGSADPVDLQFCVAADPAHFNFTFPPLVRLETPIGDAVLNNSTLGEITGFGKFTISPSDGYYALRMILSGGGGPGGSSRRIYKIEYRWK